jgi:hypothetical protein
MKQRQQETLANLKAARAKIEAILKEHDIAGFVSLHGPDMGEVFWNIWPSYSIIKGDFPAIRLVSKLQDYNGDEAKQTDDQDQTAQMMHHLATSTGGCAMQFLELADVLNERFEAKHVDEGHIPEPSKHNPDLH